VYNKKEYLKKLNRLRAGSYRQDNSGIFLDRNERSIPYSDEIIKSLHKRLKNIHLGLYPDLNPLYRKFSNWLGISEDQIYITEGVSGAIKSLIETLTIPGVSNIIFPFPTFAMYPVYSKMFNLESRQIGYSNNYKLDYEKLIQSIDKNTAIVFLPNPNMPIEGTLNKDEMIELAEYCHNNNTILAMDEVYYPFGGPTAIDLIERFSNLFVMRSLSKAFGLASIRVGYLLGSKENIKYVSKTRTGYETNSLSMEVALYFIDNYNLILDYVSEVKVGMDFLKIELRKLNIEFNGGETGNYIYINLKSKNLSTQIVQELSNKNFFVRGGWPEPYDIGFSVTGAPKNIMKLFYDNFYEIYSKKLEN